MLSFHIFDTGYCLSSEHLVIQGGMRRSLECHATAILLEHPREGFILFDTGYASRVVEAMRHFPFSVYRRITPIFHREEQSVHFQIRRLGLQTRDIRYVILSHFHADHMGGLKDFPEARVICSAEGLGHVICRQGFSALKCAFVPELLPIGFEDRAHLIHHFEDLSLGVLGATHDIFQDGCLRLFSLPGHARGQLGLWAETSVGPVIFASDGCYLSQSYRENRPPHPVTSLFVDSSKATVQTLDRLHRFYVGHPEVKIYPCHCPEVAQQALSWG